MDLLKELLGDDRLLFGSDFPHAEGLADPLAFTADIPNFDADETRKVMRDNARALIGIRFSRCSRLKSFKNLFASSELAWP